MQHAVRNTQAQLIAILSATLPLSKHQTFWKNLFLPEHTGLGLLRDDLYLLNRYPMTEADEMAKNFAKPRTGVVANYLRQHNFPQRGVGEGYNAITDFDSVFAFHRLPHYPLTLFVNTPTKNLVAHWWQQAQLFYALVAIFLASGVAAYFWIMQRQRAWAAERAKAEQRIQMAAQAMENTVEGIMITDANQLITFVNKGFTGITGYSAEEMLGAKPSMLSSGKHDDEFYVAMWRDLRQNGHWQGEIWDRRKNGEVYAQLLSISAINGEQGEVTHYVGVFNDISQYKQYEDKLKFLATYDPLSNLPNRGLLQDRIDEAIERAKRNAQIFCVLFVDLDRFKVVNDSLGHQIGDEMLREIAARLTHCVRASDTVARFGGDEFAVVLENLHNTEEAALIASKLIENLRNPINVEGHELFTSASIGISCFPKDGEDTVTLLKHADIAMYRAKEEGRGKYQFFSSSMNAHLHEFMALANSLHAALDNGELFLEYQPRVCLHTGKVTGAEALIRWNHPTLGRTPPDRFIPLAEETGLIVSIGAWVMRTVCNQGKVWADQGYPLRIAINLSPRQFREKDLASQILAASRESGYGTDLLEVEITESLMMHDPESVRDKLAELSKAGIKVAVDDFGTGHSSLSYLKHFPLHYVKIDRSFVHDVPGDADSIAIVRTIIAMARNLRHELIAEGIETVEQAQLLRDEGCGEAQGYLFSRPLSAQAFEALLHQSGGRLSLTGPMQPAP